METFITTPRGTVTIHPVKEEDVQAYRDLRLQALRNHPEAFAMDYAANLAKPMTYWTEQFHSYSPDLAKIIYFAVHNECMVGMGGISRRNSPKIQHSANIWGVYVQPDWRGFHIAEELITACIDWARIQAVKIVKIAVVTTNTAAIRCYTRCGFKVYGIEPQALYYNDAFYDELLMARTVKSQIRAYVARKEYFAGELRWR